jgi:hypothetical protein
VANAGIVAVVAFLKRNPAAVVTDCGIGSFVAGDIGEMGDPLGLARAVKLQKVEVDVAGSLGVVAVTFDQSVAAIGADSFRLVILAGGLRVIHDFAGLEIEAENLRGEWFAAPVLGECQLLFSRGAEILRLKPILIADPIDCDMPVVEQLLLAGEGGGPVSVNDIRHPDFFVIWRPGDAEFFSGYSRAFPNHFLAIGLCRFRIKGIAPISQHRCETGDIVPSGQVN